MVDEALKALDAEFNALYADLGRDSIPPEKLLRAQLLMALYIFAASGSWSRRSTTTCCSAGLWVSP